MILKSVIEMQIPKKKKTFLPKLVPTSNNSKHPFLEIKTRFQPISSQIHYPPLFNPMKLSSPRSFPIKANLAKFAWDAEQKTPPANFAPMRAIWSAVNTSTRIELAFKYLHINHGRCWHPKRKQLSRGRRAPAKRGIFSISDVISADVNFAPCSRRFWGKW